MNTDRKTHRGTLLLALALAGSTCLAACGGADDGDLSPPAGDAPPASLQDPAAPPPVGTDVGAARGDTASIVGDTAPPAPVPPR